MDGHGNWHQFHSRATEVTTKNEVTWITSQQLAALVTRRYLLKRYQPVGSNPGVIQPGLSLPGCAMFMTHIRRI